MDTTTPTTTTARDRLEDPAPLSDCLHALADVLFCEPERTPHG